jgi:succinate dehydrogenase/fumarate reductase flavoprotein subunit
MADLTRINGRKQEGGADLSLTADVLVIGGGPAGIWAALTAIQHGARVIIAEKGYVGTAGPLSSANTGIYYIKPDDPIHREGTVGARLPLAFDLADKIWIERTFDQAFANLDAMARWGYKWPKNEEGKEYRGRLRGPDVLFFLREQLRKHGVRILDHSPALELLTDGDVVAGAAGLNRQTGEQWEVRAAAIVLATGGTAFLSKIAGARGNTGDGYLMAAEAGAEFSGMEFSSQYAPAPADGVLSRGAHLDYGTLYDNDGKEILRGRQTVQAIERTGAAWAHLNKTKDDETRAMVRQSHAHIFVHLDRLGIDPFRERYQIDFRLEGTIRAAGGLAIDDDLSSTVPGLFVAGDLASRERVTGAGPPGGGPAASWAFASGTFAGRSAAAFARSFRGPLQSRSVTSLGGAALRPVGARRDQINVKDIIASVQSEMIPFDRNYWRSGNNLAASIDRFNREWDDVRDGLGAVPTDDSRAAAREILRVREAAAMLATARWINVSALERTETRGLHRRSDFPNLDPAQTYHLITGGLDKVWLKHRQVARTEQALAS